MTRILIAAMGMALAGTGPGCAGAPVENAQMSIKVETPSFQDGGDIPVRFTCKGQNRSPALHWQGAPANTKSLALTVTDPDAPFHTFIHWVLYDLPAGTNRLPEGVPVEPQLPDGSRQGMNGFDLVGYEGPCPGGSSPHRYVFTIYALDSKLGLKPKASEKELRKAMAGHILAEGKLVGRYHE